MDHTPFSRVTVHTHVICVTDRTQPSGLRDHTHLSGLTSHIHLHGVTDHMYLVLALADLAPFWVVTDHVCLFSVTDDTRHSGIMTGMRTYLAV